MIASPTIRKGQAASVTESLERSGKYESDQGAIWGEIEEMSERAGIRSATRAMKDVYEDKVIDLDKYLKTFKYVPHQRGLLVFINREVVAFDIVSLGSAYEILHPKLVKSYAMDALLQKRRKSPVLLVDKAKAFLEETIKCKEKKYKSIGHGLDYRLEGKRILGSALIYRKKVVHMAFFRSTERSKAGRMSGYRQREEFRESPGEADAFDEQLQTLS